jgi:hypothetical protein
MVFNVNEYETSQIYAACLQDIKLCDVGSRRDPFITRPAPVAKKHLVQGCTNTTCQTI